MVRDAERKTFYRIQLEARTVVPRKRQVRVQVTTELSGFRLTEPKPLSCANLRVANGISEVEAHMPFWIFLAILLRLDRYYPRRW